MTQVIAVIVLAFLIMPLMFGIAISQHGYYIYERWDDSIAVYKTDIYGHKYPMAEFMNLGHLLASLGLPP